MTLTSQQVYDKLKVPHSVNGFDELDGTTVEFIEVKGDNYKAKFTSFDKMVFEELVCFENTQLSVGLIFKTCTFNDPLIFSNVSANAYDDLLNPDSQNILFEDCIFKDIVILQGENGVIDGDVYFKKSTFEKGLEVTYLRINSGSFLIDSCTINGNVNLFYIETGQNISLANNTINSTIILGNIKCNSLEILSNNIFSEDFHIREGSFTIGINFNNGTFKKDVRLSQVQSQKEGLTIIGSNFEESFFVRLYSKGSPPTQGLNRFYFRDTSFGNGVYVDGREHFLSDLPFVEKIELSVSAKMKGNIFFRNFNVELLELSGYNTSANMQFDHLDLMQLKINSLNNSAGLIFSDIRAYSGIWPFHENLADQKPKSIHINSTNFGKTQFYKFNFQSFDNISFHTSILTDITTSFVEWFTPNQLNDEINGLPVNIFERSYKNKYVSTMDHNRVTLISNYQSRQEIYRQLKLASQKQGDLISSLEFQRHEMNYFKKIASLQKPIKWNEYLVLWSNQTNNFGQSWVKPLWLFIVFSFIAYFPLGFFTSDKIDYSKFADSLNDVLLNLKVILWDNFHKWFIIMNPVHRTSDLADGVTKIPGFLHLFDLISRLVVSYFLFQIVSAFRKFNK